MTSTWIDHTYTSVILTFYLSRTLKELNNLRSCCTWIIFFLFFLYKTPASFVIMISYQNLPDFMTFWSSLPLMGLLPFRVRKQNHISWGNSGWLKYVQSNRIVIRAIIETMICSKIQKSGPLCENRRFFWGGGGLNVCCKCKLV